MLIAMRNFCLFWVCLACASNGRRVQPTVDRQQSPEQALERLLLNPNLAAAFNPSLLASGLGGEVRDPVLAASRPVSLQNIPARASQRPVIRMSDELQLEAPTAGADVLTNLLALVSNQDELDAAVDEAYLNMGQDQMMEIMTRVAEEPYRKIIESYRRATDKRMRRGKDTLTEMLDAGEIQKLDAKIVKSVKNGLCDVGFILVLNQNIDAAQTDAESKGDDHAANTKLNILTHISTRMQEELEKLQKPETGILHKLMRSEDAGLRGRILQHYLTPQKEIKLPDGSFIPVDEPKDALVDPIKFSQAVIELVDQLKMIGRQDSTGDTITSMVNDVRLIAIEARTVIEQAYPESVLTEFSEALAPTFNGVREANQQEQAEKQAS